MFEIGDVVRRKGNNHNFVIVDKGTYFYELENIVLGDKGQVAKNLVELDFELSEDSTEYSKNEDVTLEVFLKAKAKNGDAVFVFDADEFLVVSASVTDDIKSQLIRKYGDKEIKCFKESKQYDSKTKWDVYLLEKNNFDNVNKPKHYNVFEIEVLDIIRILLQGNENYKKDVAYKIGNVIKYIFRAGLKGDMLEDLQKAKFYLDSIIEDSTK